MRTIGLKQYLTKQEANTLTSVNEEMEFRAETRKRDK